MQGRPRLRDIQSPTPDTQCSTPTSIGMDEQAATAVAVMRRDHEWLHRATTQSRRRVDHRTWPAAQSGDGIGKCAESRVFGGHYRTAPTARDHRGEARGNK